jgi:DNA polymerase I-like protein with 3'-5' exonuclease and polymerase domains
VIAIVSAENEEELLVELEALTTTAKQTGLELLTQILKYKKLSKQMSMTLERFTNPVTGRIHPRFSPLRASTSRFASSSPNIQQVPARLDLELDFSLDELSQMFDIKI